VLEASGKIIVSDDDSYTNAVSQEEEKDSIHTDRNFETGISSREPHLLTQEDFNDLMRDLNLLK
jgi:hypothetical protein